LVVRATGMGGYERLQACKEGKRGLFDLMVGFETDRGERAGVGDGDKCKESGGEVV
jgi:hypothetical protein